MINKNILVALFEEWACTMAAQRDYLIELDSVVGDGDLGLTMSDGFKAAYDSVRESQETDIGKILYIAGKRMAQAVPSTMGTLIASGFMEAGMFSKGKTELDLSNFADTMEAFLNGIMKRGKAQVGEKTIVDGLYPAVQILKKKAGENATWKDACKDAATAAAEGFMKTADMIAVHGRAATRGEASRTLLDPGAAVAKLFMEAIHRVSSRFDI